jgi:hypothetical protein
MDLGGLDPRRENAFVNDNSGREGREGAYFRANCFLHVGLILFVRVGIEHDDHAMRGIVDRC